MGFPFPSSGVAELPKGLTRSEAVAIYQLLPTPVAASPRVDITVNVCVRNTDYRETIPWIPEDSANSPDVVARSTAQQNYLSSLTIVEQLQRTPSDKALLAASELLTHRSRTPQCPHVVRPSDESSSPWKRMCRTPLAPTENICPG